MTDDIRRIRVFVSSPADARFERSRLERVIARLNGEFQGIALLTPIRWETEFYKAHDTFQAQIPDAAQCDLVIAIFRARLGTVLPAEFPRMKDGRSYPSGTAYEVLSAIENAKMRGFPDVYVFRFPQPPSVQLDDPQRAEIEAQWEQLKVFFDTWFRTPAGEFKAAFHTFRSTDDFEAQVEALLRKWLEEKVLHGRPAAWPVKIKGSPFRGLTAFDATCAEVFFGRRRDIALATERLAAAAQSGTAYLLVIGASGVGKSSFVQAGLVPRLITPGVIGEVDEWRVVILRPESDPAAALSTALYAGQGAGEDGGGFVDMSGGDYPTADKLTQLIRRDPAGIVDPVIGALDRAAEKVR